ncbi:MAG: hypothetical protein PHV20_06310 [Bacteroidales bacterium]|nr:hypothetical protein [Bacteroidales bacterium]
MKDYSSRERNIFANDAKVGRLIVFITNVEVEQIAEKLLSELPILGLNNEDICIGCQNSTLVDHLNEFETNPELFENRNIEPDLSAIIKRNPAFVVMEEMEHCYICNYRLMRRAEDIIVLLSKNIGVITTLNISKIESNAKLIDIQNRFTQELILEMLNMAEIKWMTTDKK